MRLRSVLSQDVGVGEIIGESEMKMGYIENTELGRRAEKKLRKYVQPVGASIV